MNTKAEIVEPKADFVPKFTREDHSSLAEFLLLLAEIEKKINRTYAGVTHLTYKGSNAA